mmetsp:Transcript_32043/g.41408  ORF Transcript_32043/g.41408 Transcript_32043/m.41408 type:complete len:88 (-) Transcript_32043:31-294(-)
MGTPSTSIPCNIPLGNASWATHDLSPPSASGAFEAHIPSMIRPLEESVALSLCAWLVNVVMACWREVRVVGCRDWMWCSAESPPPMP